MPRNYWLPIPRHNVDIDVVPRKCTSTISRHDVDVDVDVDVVPRRRVPRNCTYTTFYE